MDNKTLRVARWILIAAGTVCMLAMAFGVGPFEARTTMFAALALILVGALLPTGRGSSDSSTDSDEAGEA